MDDTTKTERLKAALWYSTGQTVDAVALSQDINATPHFIGGLSELVWGQIEMLANDLEAYAKHGGRTIINCDDVLLVARRNESLAEILNNQVKAAREAESSRN